MWEPQLAKITSKIRQYGFFIVLKRIINRTFKKIGFFHETYFFCIRKLPEPAEFIQPPPGYTARKLTLEDLLHHSLISFSAQKQEIFRQRFACPNYSGIGVFTDEKMVCFGWVSYKTIEVPFPMPANDPLALTAEESYIVDVFTHPEHRGKGVNPYCTYQLFDLIRKSGRTIVVTIVDKDNKAARNTFKRCGFVIKKRIDFKRSFGKTSVYSEPSTESL